MKFIHAADIHLDSPLVGLAAYDGAPVDRLRGATRKAFQAMVDLALDEAVDLVVIAGDLYDGDWRDFNTGLFFVQQMARLHQRGIPVVAVHGNHDAESQITRRLTLPKNVTILSSRRPETHRIEGLNVAVHGQSFRQREVPDDLSAAYPAPVAGWFNIGLLHTSADGRWRDDHATYAPCDPRVLAHHGYDYWALGHVHRREVLHEHPHIVFPGNLQGRHIRETGPKGCTLVTVAHGQVTALEHRPVDVLRWAFVEADLTGAESQGELLHRVRGALEQALDAAEDRTLAARLRLTGATALHGMLHARFEAIQAELRAVALELAVDAVWIEKIVLDTSPARDLDALHRRQDAVGSLVRSLDEIGADPEGQAVLLKELDDLLAKIPPDIFRDRDDLAALREPDRLAGLIEDAKAIVLSRLLDRDMNS
jgi:exonuclease SbcD